MVINEILEKCKTKFKRSNNNKILNSDISSILNYNENEFEKNEVDYV